jgi:hypothetical protein
VRTLLECVPDPQHGPGTPPCPQGKIIVPLDYPLLELLSDERFWHVAEKWFAVMIVLFLTGLAAGLIQSIIEGK